MTQSIVHGVSHGTHSDYMVLAVFDTREKATMYMDNFKHRCWGCEKFSKIEPIGAEECKCPACGEAGFIRSELNIEEFTFNPEPDDV